MNQKNLIIGVILLIVVSTAIVFTLDKRPKFTSHEFNGTVQSLSGNTMVVKGEFIHDIKPEVNTQEASEVEITVDANTKLTRTLLILPSEEQLRASNGVFNTNDLEKITSESNLTELQKDAKQGVLGVFVKTKNNIYGSKKFIASEINYRAAGRQ